MTYGLQIQPRHDGDPRSVIGEVTTSPSGNIVLGVGRESRIIPNSPHHVLGWHQTEHIVLDPEEAEALIEELQANLHRSAAKQRLEAST